MIEEIKSGDLCRIRTPPAGFIAKREPTGAGGYGIEPIWYGRVKWAGATDDVQIVNGALVRIDSCLDGVTVGIRLETHPDLGPYSIPTYYLTKLSALEQLARVSK